MVIGTGGGSLGRVIGSEGAVITTAGKIINLRRLWSLLGSPN